MRTTLKKKEIFYIFFDFHLWHRINISLIFENNSCLSNLCPVEQNSLYSQEHAWFLSEWDWSRVYDFLQFLVAWMGFQSRVSSGQSLEFHTLLWFLYYLFTVQHSITSRMHLYFDSIKGSKKISWIGSSILQLALGKLVRYERRNYENIASFVSTSGYSYSGRWFYFINFLSNTDATE